MTLMLDIARAGGFAIPCWLPLTLPYLVDHPFLKLSAMSQPMNPLVLLGSWLIQML